jgi:hypothetical protein
MGEPKTLSIKLPNGDEVELYTISSLAFALGRSAQLVRKWEISGVIPKTPFKDARKRRLYTQEQIDIIVSNAERYKLAQGRSISATNFTVRCFEQMNDLYIKYGLKGAK